MYANTGISQVQKQTPVYTSLSTHVRGYYESLPVDYNSSPGKKYPLLIFIHGKGELGDGSASQLPRVLVNGPAKLINQGKFPNSFTVQGEKFSFIVISPQFVSNNYDVSADNISDVINFCKQKYRIDEERIYVTGLSMGGGFAWRFMGKYPELIAAGLAVCGSASNAKQDVDRIVSSNLPVWATHNSGDPTVSVNVTKKWIDALNAHIPAPDPKPIMTIFESNSHDAWSKTYDPGFKENGLNVYEWMLSYKRGGTVSTPPVANAGANQTITLPVNSVTLDGTKSTAPTGMISSYAWTKVSGPSGGTISSAGSSKTTVTSLSEGTYQFQLKVTDNKGGTSTAVVTIKVNPAPLLPVANAGGMQIITLPVNSVTLDGTKSTAPSGSITTYQWSKLSGPSSGIIVTPAVSVTSVTGLIEGVYVFQLKVTDSNGGTSAATVSITVNAAPAPPIADAGNDQTIDLPVSSITLDGSNSVALAGSIVSYRWNKLSGPSGEKIATPTSVSTTVSGLIKGVYQFELKVTDNNGVSSTATVTITVKAAPLPPVADAGSAQTITLPNNSITLNGTASAAPGDIISAYVWRKLSGPSGGTITDPLSAVTTVAGLIEGIYKFELEVTNSKNLSSTSVVTITVKAAPLPPVANAGSAQIIILPDNSVTLNGSASIAPSGTISSYAWSKVSGSSEGTITSPGSAVTTITGLIEGTYIFELEVTDSNGASSTATVTITVKAAPLPPVANAGSAQTITLPDNNVTLDGSESTAPSGTISSYAWSKVSGPSEGTITSPGSAVTTITGLIEGTYIFELKVTDSNGASSTATVTITVKAAPLPPVADAGSAQTITLPDNNVTLDGSASTAPSGTISSYAWGKVSGPSEGTITSPGSAVTTITGLIEGTYIFELKVTDSNGGISTASVTITVKAALLPPVADAGMDKTISLPDNSVILDGSASTAPSGTINSYAWSKVSGPAAGNIITPDNAVTTIDGLSEGVYQFELKVTDNNGLSTTSIVTVTVSTTLTPPVADAGAAQTLTLPVNTAILDGSASVASSGTISTYQWAKISGPADENITNPDSDITSVTNLKEGVYKFQLTVTDNNGASSTASVTITVKAAPLPPVANGGSAQTITLPDNSVTLDGSASTAPSGTISSYAWSKVSGPSGGVISSLGSAITTVTDLAEGIYVFELNVTDNNGASSTASVTITVKAALLPPVADAGSAQTITLPNNSITLDGSASTAPSGTIDSYSWTKLSGPSGAVITSSGSAVTAITGLTEGVYIFELNVTDNNGSGSTATVTVTVKAAPLPPVADAGSAQTITLPDNSVTLDGSASTAPSGTIDSYSWTKLSGPSGAVITSSGSDVTVVTGLTEGVYIFELNVTDNNGYSSTATVTVTVKAAPLPPVADAGSAQTITLPNNSITLDGSGSSASAGNHLVSYQWSKISGPSEGIITDNTGIATTVTELVIGVYKFQLEITDDKGEKATSMVTVTVNAAPPPPVVNAGNDQTIILPVNNASLDGSKSIAPGGSIVNYEWVKVSGPSGGNIVNPSEAVSGVNNLEEGRYQFRLKITDNRGSVAIATVFITVEPAPLPPVANAGNTQTITLPDNHITLDGSQSSARSGQIKTFSWSKVSGPSAGVISNANGSVTSVSQLDAGTYVFQLKVTDTNGNSATASVTVIVNPVPFVPPIANAGDDISVQLPLNQIALNGSGSYARKGKIESYKWEKISGPDALIILNSNSATPVIQNVKPGIYIFRLLVEDSNGFTDLDEVKITVMNEEAILPPPVADAGESRTIALTSEEIFLDGGSSYAQFGNIEKYKWVMLSGPSDVEIDNAESDLAMVSGMVVGEYVFELTVTDNTGKADKATVKITVTNASGRPDMSPVIKVFPNPVSDVASIELQGPAKGRTGINIFDANGRRVYKTEFIKDDLYVNHRLNMSGLVKGVYFIEVVIDYQYRSVIKIIKL
ncbi:MAG: PKD domain-containing protein [Chitinophagaceae bacterium]|nr:PKD domain-containing protein [Chitinophagaceae bacterium]